MRKRKEAEIMKQNEERDERLMKRNKKTKEEQQEANPDAIIKDSSTGGNINNDEMIPETTEISTQDSSSNSSASSKEQKQESQSAKPPGQNKPVSGILSQDIQEKLQNLQDLSQILSIANENTFGSSSGFKSSEIVKNLITLISEPPNQLNTLALELHPDILLLSYRCLYNLIEADPGSMHSFCAAKGLDSLVANLMQIEYIDLAEQILVVIEKISIDYPASVLKANGIVAVLQYLDFFSLHVQRTCTQIVANSCMGLPYGGPTSVNGNIC